MSILNELEKFIVEAEEEATPSTSADTENVGDAPVETDDTIDINFSDLKEEVQEQVKDLLMKELNATDEFSMNNIESKLTAYSIFRGTVKEFKTTLGIDNK